MKRFLFAAMLLGLAAPPAAAGPVDDIAEALVVAEGKPITPDSLPADFARLARFIRHDGNGMVLFTDGGSTDGYVRHAQAHFDTAPAARGPDDKHPLFTIAFELVDQPDFTFDGLSAALERQLGTPNLKADRPGATFRTWLLKQQDGRSLTIAKGHASDDGGDVTVVQLIQGR